MYEPAGSLDVARLAAVRCRPAVARALRGKVVEVREGRRRSTRRRTVRRLRPAGAEHPALAPAPGIPPLSQSPDAAVAHPH